VEPEDGDAFGGGSSQNPTAVPMLRRGGRSFALAAADLLRLESENCELSSTPT